MSNLENVVIDYDDPIEIEKHNNRKLTADKIRQILSKVLERRSSSERRWIWELMQNAKDVPNKFGKVSIQIILQEDKLLFKHNGDPFSLSNIFSLIQQVSSKDSTNTNEEVTGKFGTGFISTHLLSEIIEVEGVVKHKGGYRSFEVVLDRAGETSEELLPKIERALDKIRNIEDDNDYPPILNYEEERKEENYSTCFTYKLTSDARFKSAKTGIDDLINTLPQTLANLPKIKRVEVINETEEEVTKQVYECTTVKNETLYRKSKVEIFTDIETTSKYFVSYKLEDLALVAEVSSFEEMHLLETFGKQPNLFRDFPLIGSEKFYFPYLINGFKLNPTEDRDGILLHSFESRDAEKNRNYIELAIEGALEFTKWLIAQNAHNRYVCAFSRLPDEKWEQESKDWYIDYQKGWREELVDLALIETAVNLENKEELIVSLREGTIPAYGNRNTKHEIQLQFYDLAQPILGKENIPKRELLLNWISALGPEEEMEYWGIEIRTDLDGLLELVSEAETKEELTSRHFDSVTETEEWLNKLYAFLIQEKETELFDTYAIIPNQNGDFNVLESLCLENEEAPIPDFFLDILEEMDNEQDWRADLIDREVQLPNQNIETRDLDDIKEAINDILKEETRNNYKVYENQFIKRSDALSILTKLVSIIDERSTRDDFRSNMFVKGKKLFKFERDFTVVPNSKDFNYDPALRLFIKLINKEIEAQENLETLANSLALEESMAVVWLNEYLNQLAAKENFKTLLDEGNIVLNRDDELCAFESLKSFGEEGVPLNDELIDILYNLDNNQDWKMILVRNGITIKLNDKKTFEELGTAIEMKVTEIEIEGARDPDIIDEYKDDLLDLIEWCNDHPELTRDYLKSFESKAKEFFFKLTLEGSNVSMDAIKMLQDKENVELLDELSKSNVDKEKLKKLVGIADQLGSLDKIIDHAEDLLEIKEDFDFKLKIGSTVENVFAGAIKNENIDAEVIYIGKGAYDLQVKSNKNDKSFFIELKSFKSESTLPLHFAESQASFATKNPQNFAICTLERPDKLKDVTIPYIQQYARFKMNLGPIFQFGLNDLSTFNAISTSQKITRLHLVLMEDIRIQVDRSVIEQSASSFTSIISQIKAYLA